MVVLGVLNMKLQLVLKIDSESFDEYKLLKTATLLNSPPRCSR